MRELVRHGSTEQLVLRAVVALGGMLFAGVLTLASGRDWFDLGTAVIPALLSIAAALYPRNVMPLALLLYLVILWVGVNDDVRTAWTLPAAALILLMHSASALAAVLPIAAPVPRQMWASWGGRIAALMGITVIAWMIVRAMAGMDVPFAAFILLVSSGAFSIAALAHDRWAKRL